MARLKRNSATIEETQRFLESLQTISETLDFGNGASVQALQAEIEKTQRILSHYNKQLNLADEAMRNVDAAEASLKKMAKRLKDNVKAFYGENSQEYLKAGGKPRSNEPIQPSQPVDVPEMEMIVENQPAVKNGAK